MKVIPFSPYPDTLKSALKDDTVVDWTVTNMLDTAGADFLVSFGHNQIFTPGLIGMFPKRIINIHVGFLPWNRGADPNFWSWFDGTKKGVTIHYIDAGIDTGDIIFQVEIEKFRRQPATLRSTYDELRDTAVKMFGMSWPSIKRGGNFAIPQHPESGSYHKKKDKDPWMGKLTRGWDTPVSVIEELGRKHREGA